MTEIRLTVTDGSFEVNETIVDDASSDGERFLMLKPTERIASLTQIVVVQNWFEELKRLVLPGEEPGRVGLFLAVRFARISIRFEQRENLIDKNERSCYYLGA